jgi:inorganic pyrophosphatase/exopolyphosphatase
MNDQGDEINSSIVVATLVEKLQELLAHAVETAMHTPDYFFNVVRYEKVAHKSLHISS